MNTNDFYRKIRERVSAADVAKYYGMAFDRGGKKAICPYRADKHPSLSFYKGGFRCFACGASGSSLDLTMQLLGIDLKAAAARLNLDFNLGLDREPTAAEREAARRVTDARKLFTDWRDKMLNALDAAIRVANTADMEDPSDTEALAIRYKESFESWADVLQHSPLDEQMKIFRERKEIERLCRMTLQNTPMKSKTA